MTPPRPTYKDIEALPPGVRGEIIGGRLVALPRPAPPHSNATSGLCARLHLAFQVGDGGPGGWWIQFEPELSLDVDPDFDPVVPDIAGWRLETMPDLPGTSQYPIVPDWVCEVLSPSTAESDRAEKMPFYARAGVGHLWLVDPVLTTLEAYRRDGVRWLWLGTWHGDVTVRPEPFDTIELALGPLWRRKTTAAAIP